MLTLDLTGLKCPLPALLARRALRRSEPGTEIEVIADDPMARIDIPHMCRQDGYECVHILREEAGDRLLLRRPV
jgi:tRNA 2-thiouridine synthesizing protein A